MALVSDMSHDKTPHSFVTDKDKKFVVKAKYATAADIASGNVEYFDVMKPIGALKQRL